MLLILEDTVGTISTTLQVDDVGGDQPGVKVRAAHDTSQFVQRFVIGKHPHE